MIHLVAGGLSDRNLLTLSKKLGEDWQKLGKCLGQSEEELQEVLEGEGSGYQGGFKTLWNWRDTLNEMEEEHNLQTLKQALLKVGKFELFSAVFQTN